MSGFQTRFMKIAESAHNTNLVLVQRYKEDSIKVVDDLYREISELQHAKAHFKELKNRDRLKMFFNGLEYRFNAGLKKYTLEFTEEATETYNSYDKRLKNFFVEEGVRPKDIYHHIENNSDADNSVFIAKANNIHIETSMLNDVQIEIFNKSDKIINHFKLKKLLLGIILPIVLMVLFLAGKSIISNVAENAAKKEVSEAITSQLDANGQLTDIIVNSGASAVEKIKFTTAPINPFKIIIDIVVGLVTIAIWMIYYVILSLIIKNTMIRKLEQDMSVIYGEILSRKSELQDAYAEWLTIHLNKMNTKYFMKYKPLIDMVMDQ